MSKHGGRPADLRISGTGLPGGTKVELNGEDIAAALTGLTLKIGLTDRPTAVLDMLLWDVSTGVENPRLVVPEATRKVLLQLGWTPPEGDGAS